ncbi:hypothetical protein B0H14DRAFT_2583018 [Mycena olivaceomarginata]|nr:hypothetical protein B0H14DRAFT_2583018 [Mycena olivaceomarginata]
MPAVMWFMVRRRRTRAVQKIKDVTKIQSYVPKYRQARTALIALGCNPQQEGRREGGSGSRQTEKIWKWEGSQNSGSTTFLIRGSCQRGLCAIGKSRLPLDPQDPKFGFPKLRDEDLYTKNVDQPHNLGNGGKIEGWIWQQGYHENSSEVEGAEYFPDLQWHHAHVDMEQWLEEVEILAQEFHHAIQGFNKMETVWTALAHDHQEDPGKKAYALKKANMYQEMGKDAQEKFAKVGGTWLRAGVSLTQHIKSERPDQKIDWDASIAEKN